MAQLTAETVKAVVRELYEYEISDEAASTVAHMAGAMATYSRRLDALELAGVQPPFGYSALIAEAERLRRR